MLIVLLVGGLGFCLVYFVLTPQIKAYAQIKTDLTDTRSKLSRAQATAASLKSESERLTKAKETFLVKGKPFSNIMRDGSDVLFLGLTSAYENVEILSLEPGEIKENSHSFELPLKIVAQGDHLKLVSFYKDIDKQLKKPTNLAEIRSLKIESSTQASGSGAMVSDAGAAPGTVKATMGIVMFSAKNPEGKLYLEEVSRWLMGRGNIFRPALALAPYPELSGYVNSRNAASLPVSGQNTASNRGIVSNGSSNTQSINAEPEYNLKK
jgi:type IV pilus assembly protein PilO